MSKYSLLQSKSTGQLVIKNNKTGELTYKDQEPEKYSDLRRKALSNRRQAERNDCLKSLGLVKTAYGWE
jgi:hypothetical protein